MENNSQHSSILTDGGAPGSFGPMGDLSDSAPSSFGSWATTVDLLPVPIEFKFGSIGDLLPERAGGLNLRENWYRAVKKVVDGIDISTAFDPDQSTEYIITVSHPSCLRVVSFD